MRVIVVGGGKVGGHLARRLHDDGHAVFVIERRHEIATRLSETSRCLVIEGDGTEIEVLQSADIDRADWLIAVTGLDEVNLVACELGETLGRKGLKVIARMNDPRNQRTFEALGIRPVSVTDLMVQLIANAAEADVAGRVLLGDLLGERLCLVDIDVDEDVPERLVVDLVLPEDTILIRVVRGTETLVPRGDTAILGGDRVLAVTPLEREPAVHAALNAVPHAEVTS
jgi:trk system potassium uptake protein TrkA